MAVSIPDSSARSQPQRATMHDVAALAGVSLKSVSRVVNREAGVSPALAERVERAVLDLGYRHNLGASFLRRGRRTASIGMLVQDLSNGYCSETLRAVEDRARQEGVVVMASSIDEDPRREREIVEGLVARRIDGLILMPTARDLSWLQPDIDAGLAVVCIDRRPALPELDAVLADNQGSSAEATGHLLAHGHRRIAFLGDIESIPTASERRDGYRAAMRAAGLRPDPGLEVMGLRSRDEARAATSELMALTEAPTAIFAGRNVITEGAILGLRDCGRQLTTALVGFDEVAVAEMVSPQVTVVRQGIYQIGQRAIDRLLARLGNHDAPIHVDVVGSDIVIRGSGEIRPSA